MSGTTDPPHLQGTEWWIGSNPEREARTENTHGISDMIRVLGPENMAFPVTGG